MYIPPRLARVLRSEAVLSKDCDTVLINSFRFRTGILSVRVDARSRIKSERVLPLSSSSATMVKIQRVCFVVAVRFDASTTHDRYRCDGKLFSDWLLLLLWVSALRLDRHWSVHSPSWFANITAHPPKFA